MHPVAEPETLEVPGDRPVHVAHAPPDDRRAVVYLHGKCKMPASDFATVAELARAHGTLVALEADTECESGGLRWTTDEAAIQARIDAALGAVAKSRGDALDASALTIIGESQGAARAEGLTRRAKDRYRQVVLVSEPTTLQPTSFDRARAVATLAGTREGQEEMRGGAAELGRSGTDARFFSIADAAHGEFNHAAVLALDEALTFVQRE